MLLLFFHSLIFIKHICVDFLSLITLGRHASLCFSWVHSNSRFHFVLLNSIIIYCLIICLTFCCRLHSKTLWNIIDFAPSRLFNEATLYFIIFYCSFFCYFFIISMFCIVLRYLVLLFRRQVHSLKLVCVCGVENLTGAYCWTRLRNAWPSWNAHEDNAK